MKPQLEWDPDRGPLGLLLQVAVDTAGQYHTEADKGSEDGEMGGVREARVQVSEERSYSKFCVSIQGSVNCVSFCQNPTVVVKVGVPPPTCEVWSQSMQENWWTECICCKFCSPLTQI